MHQLKICTVCVEDIEKEAAHAKALPYTYIEGRHEQGIVVECVLA